MKKSFYLVAAGAVSLLGCSQDPTKPNLEFIPDMADAVPYEAFAPNPNTPDGKTLQRPPVGSIARGQRPFHYGPGPEEAARAGREVVSPLQASPEVVALGQQRFATFCAPCHGATGLGDGTVIPKFPAPPSLTAEHAKGLADGQLFHIITHGQGVMPSHASQIQPEDRWRIVHFIRSMQGKGAQP